MVLMPPTAQAPGRGEHNADQKSLVDNIVGRRMAKRTVLVKVK
jgi:hypothetical protein